MSSFALAFLVPGPIDQRTGGYLYDARMVAGLRARGWRVDIGCLTGVFPQGDSAARGALTKALARIPDGARVVIDGLAMGGLPEPVQAHGTRLRVLGLIHHPLADETGLSAAESARLAQAEALALGACTGVLVTSPYTKARLNGLGVPADRIRVVIPGTDPAPTAMGPPAGAPPQLLCVGTITPRKGQDVLIQALGDLRDLSWTCVCAGSLDRDPVFARSVLDQVAAADLSGRITFAGELAASELEELYRTSSLFVLASHFEGYGMALTEALARGLPVVSTTGGAIPHTVPSDAGILVSPGNAQALARALRRLLTGASRESVPGSSASNLSALSRAARDHARSLPDWGSAAETFERAIVDLAPDRGVTTGGEPRGDAEEPDP